MLFVGVDVRTSGGLSTQNTQEHERFILSTTSNSLVLFMLGITTPEHAITAGPSLPIMMKPIVIRRSMSVHDFN